LEAVEEESKSIVNRMTLPFIIYKRLKERRKKKGRVSKEEEEIKDRLNQILDQVS
jgi:hypothetical protein